MPTLKPIRAILKHRTHASGDTSVFPDFRSHYNTNPEVFNNKRPSKFFDEDGVTWRYNKIENLGTGAPNGEAIALIAKVSADAIIAQFPLDVFSMSEAELETFWDEKAHAHIPDNKRSDTELRALREELSLKKELGIAYGDTEVALSKALDPDDPSPGIVRNKDKKWADFKARLNITIEQ